MVFPENFFPHLYNPEPSVPPTYNPPGGADGGPAGIYIDNYVNEKFIRFSIPVVYDFK